MLCGDILPHPLVVHDSQFVLVPLPRSIVILSAFIPGGRLIPGRFPPPYIQLTILEDSVRVEGVPEPDQVLHDVLYQPEEVTSQQERQGRAIEDKCALFLRSL